MSQAGTVPLQTGAGNPTRVSPLVLKAGADREVCDPARGLYSHLTPDGVWLPGGASNVGAASLGALVPSAAGREGAFDDEVATVSSPVVVYPLPFAGERFPWRNATATATVVGGDWAGLSMAEAYRAVLEGVALVERWGLEVLADAGVPSRRHVLSGGASQSLLWNRIRASALGRSVQVASTRDSGFGAAVLAASVLRGEALSVTAAALARPALTVEPDAELHRRLDEQYARLREAIG